MAGAKGVGLQGDEDEHGRRLGGGRLSKVGIEMRDQVAGKVHLWSTMC